MNRREALEALKEGGTHTFYIPEFAGEVQQAFGMPVRVQTLRANTRDPKGLFVEGLPANSQVAGYASHDLAESIARHLGLHGVWEQMNGRGSRQRAALEAIGKFLDEEDGPSDETLLLLQEQ